MTTEERHRRMIDQLGRWSAQLDRLDATPFLLIAVSLADDRLHVIVPHNDAAETALMVEVLRKAADDLEAKGPEPVAQEG